MALGLDILANPEQGIAKRITEFLEKQAKDHNVNFDQVEIGMKNQEDNGQLKSYYYLRVNGKFNRYIKIKELL